MTKKRVWCYHFISGGSAIGMKQKSFTTLIFIFIFTIVLFMVIVIIVKPFSPLPQESTSAGIISQSDKGVIMFWDNFMDGDSSGWEMSDSFSLAKNSASYNLKCTGEGYAYLPKSIDWDKDYAFKVSYTLESGTIVFGFNAARDGRYLLAVNSNETILAKENSAGSFEILECIQSPAAAERHFVAMGCYNNIVQVYFDKQLYISIIDENPIKKGSVSISADKNSSFYIHGILANEILSIQENMPSIGVPLEKDVSLKIDKLCLGLDINSLPENGKNIPDFYTNNTPDGLTLNSNNTNDKMDTVTMIILIICAGLLFVCIAIYILYIIKTKNKPVNSNGSYPNTNKLSKREKEVLDLMLEGCTMPQIASRLFISISTAKGHSNKIYSKLNIHNRHELLLSFIEKNHHKD